jgi:hypothetical protein
MFLDSFPFTEIIEESNGSGSSESPLEPKRPLQSLRLVQAPGFNERFSRRDKLIQFHIV